MIDIRLRTKVADAAVATITGKVLGPADYDVLLTGPTYVRKPDGRPLCVFLPGALTDHYTQDVYGILHSLRPLTTNNRGMASGTRRVRRGNTDTGVASRTEARTIASTILGSFDPSGGRVYCRLTAWTGRNLPEWEQLQPLLQATATALQTYVPDRYAAQTAHAAKAHPEWIIPGTAFSTITVNNSYPTGVHVDKGDLDTGFSSISVHRTGTYTGGQLIFPQYRVAADLHTGDLILMDAHEWHGNVPITCECGTELNGPCPRCKAERISVVAYMRTAITGCGTPDEEHAKALATSDARSGLDKANTTTA